MKELVEIDESLLKLASDRTGQTEKSALVNMGLRALIETAPEQRDKNAPSEPSDLREQTDSELAVPIQPRTAGGWEGLWIADDFDETPDEFLKYISDNQD